MIKFFRKIRQNLLTENKFSKYLLYAIGEIVLVVIGILLALQINNRNEIRKTEDKVIAILKEVQGDLGSDIQKSVELIYYYKEKDSIINLVQTDKLTYEDYKNDEQDLHTLIITASHMKVHENGYTKLMHNAENIPEHLQEIIEPLSDIYIYNKYEINKFDNRMDKITDRFLDELAKNKDWFYKMSKNNLSDEMIKYFLNDPYYKNDTRVYKNSGGLLSKNITRFRQNAIKSYKIISVLVKSEEALPDFIPHHLVDLTPEQLQEYVGVYKLVKTEKFDGPSPPVQIKIWMHENELVMAPTNDIDNMFLFYFEDLDKAFFDLDIGPKTIFIRNTTNEIAEFIFRDDGKVSHFTKIKN